MQSRNLFASTLIALAATTATSIAAQAPSTGAGARYIVQAATVSAAYQDVARGGGKTQLNPPTTPAGAAHLTPGQVARLRRTAGLHVFDDRSLTTEGSVLGLLSPV